MAFKNFEDLVRQVNNVLGNQVPDNLEEALTLQNGLKGFSLLAKDVAYMLACNEEIRPDRAFLFCDFGEIPADKELAALRQLLEINFLLYLGNAPAFMRDPNSNRILLGTEILFEYGTPEQVCEMLGKLFEQVTEWRRSYFLDEQKSNSKAEEESVMV